MKLYELTQFEFENNNDPIIKLETTKKHAEGGMTIGPSHEEGGVKFKVKSTGQLVELEGGEPVINATNADSDEKIIFTRPVTVKEAASCMNEMDGNGVNFRGENTPCPIKKVNE